MATPPHYVLLPFADLLNHSPGPECTALADNILQQAVGYVTNSSAGERTLPEAPGVAFNATRQCVMMRASQLFQAGESPTFCYYPYSNRDLLENYGFTLASNPYDWTEVSK